MSLRLTAPLRAYGSEEIASLKAYPALRLRSLAVACLTLG